ncbi:MAG: hypothetical protein AAF726_16985 [Planctomycetota bacterium]
MLSPLPFCVALAALSSLASAQTWGLRFDGSTNGAVFDARERSDGSIAVVHDRSFQALLSLLDANGVLLSTSQLTLGGTAIAITSTDDVAIAGVASGGGFAQAGRAVADTGGSLLWSDRLVAGVLSESVYWDVIRAQNGDLVWVGWRSTDGSDRQMIIERTTPQGVKVWSRQVGDTQRFFAGTSVAELTNGDLVVVGTSQFFRTYAAIFDPSGSLRSLHSYGESTAYDSGSQVGATDDGGALMVAGSFGVFSQPTTSRVRKIDGSGQVIWDRSYPGAGVETAVSAVGTPGGGGVVLGTSTSFGNGATDLRLLFLDADGGVVRQLVYGAGEDVRPHRLRQTSSGDLLVCGSVVNGTEERGFLLRLEPDGSQSTCLAFPSWSQPVDETDGASPLPGSEVPTSFPTTVATILTPGTLEPTSSLCLDATVGSSYCSPATPNSTGAPARISARGSLDLGENWLTLSVDSLPNGSFGYFLASRGMGVSSPPLAQGALCLNGATIARFSADPFFTANIGAAGRRIDLTAIPGQGAVTAGSTWNFQAWYRDANPGSTSNFTDARSIAY